MAFKIFVGSDFSLSRRIAYETSSSKIIEERTNDRKCDQEGVAVQAD